MKNKKTLGLLLLPLVPLSAIGVVEIVGDAVTPDKAAVAERDRPAVRPQSQQFAKPPPGTRPAPKPPQPNPAPTPAPKPQPPHPPAVR